MYIERVYANDFWEAKIIYKDLNIKYANTPTFRRYFDITSFKALMLILL